MSSTPRVIPIQPVSLMPGVEAASKVQPKSVKGRFSRLRWLMLALTQLFFFGLPWLEWQGRQMVRFDLEAKRFYLGSLIFLPQDLIFLTGLLVFCAMLLFAATTVAGRVWCGFSCPQTVYTSLFMWVERHTEGDRYQRIRLDQSGWTANKLLRRGGKHAVWIAISLWTGFTFVGWFSPIREVGPQILHGTVGFWDAFWSLFYGVACYGNAGFLREKVCLHMCPYGRFQGALMDSETLIVGYDVKRGEPRGVPRKGSDEPSRPGACVDCTLCVQVCPTGVDIRNGLQAGCVGCALCIDACDAVMDKIGQPRGLIRYARQRELQGDGLAGKATTPGGVGSLLMRHRVRLYAGVMGGLLLAMAWSVAHRTDIRVDVIRDRGVMARLVEDGAVENVYRLQLMNQTEQLQRIAITVEGLPGAQVMSRSDIVLPPVADMQWTVSVRLPMSQAARLAGQTLPIRFQVASRSATQADLVSEGSTFIVPR